MHREKSKGQAGFSMIELMAVVVIILIIAGFAVPNIMSALHMARLRGSAADFSSLLQTARLRSVQDDRFYSTYILAGTSQQAYVDLKANGGTGVDAGDPLVAISSEVTPNAAGSAPDTTNLKGQFLPTGSGLVVKDGSTTGTPVIFSPRGLPCTTQSATGGTVCDSAGGATAFWIFFQDTSTQAWEAITISPAGRIQKWQHGGSGWSKL
jgi:prepilin-type N-terminal cleavage/methylation domain-containing protein